MYMYFSLEHRVRQPPNVYCYYSFAYDYIAGDSSLADKTKTQWWTN